MRLRAFQIKGFKSIIDTGLVRLGDNQNILVLAGQNEAGKSAVLEALEFLNSGPSVSFEKLQKRSDILTEVWCEYELSDNDITYMGKQYTDKPSLMEFLTKNRVIGMVRRTSDETPEIVPVLMLDQSTGDELKKHFEVTDDAGVTTWPGYDEFSEHLLSDTYRTQIFYNEDTNYDLPGTVIASAIDQHPAVNDFEKVFGIDFKELVEKDPRIISAAESKVNKNATDDFNRYWTQKLNVGTKYGFKVKINRNATIPADSEIEFLIESYENDPNPLYLEQKSKGFRWFSAFNLRLRALGVNEYHPEDVLLLIDEPGEGLHELAQKDLKKVIDELASKGATIFYSTHNPLLIGTQGEELSRIRIISNQPEIGTKIFTLPQYASSPGLGTQDALSPLVTALGLQGVSSLKNTAKLSVIVEGISDEYYYAGFVKLLDSDDFYFIPAMGAQNVSNISSILYGWGEKHKILLDDDRAGKTAYKKLLQNFFFNDTAAAAKVVLLPEGILGVEDILSGADFRKYVTGDNSKKAQNLTNSSAAGTSKEILARLFLDKVERKELTFAKLDSVSKRKIKRLVEWLKEQF